jgi:NMD protein affecting ribosome stability and mRNA decay
MKNYYDLENELCELCNEDAAIVELFIENLSFLICEDCRILHLKGAANE